VEMMLKTPTADGEPCDAHFAVDEHRGVAARRPEILQVVVDFGGLFHRGLELMVDGDELLVRRLQSD